MVEPFAPDGPEPADDALAKALDWLRGAVAQQVSGIEKRLDVFDRVCMRLVRALSRGVEIRSMRAFLAFFLPQEVDKSVRDRGRRKQLVQQSAQDVEELAAEGTDGGAVESQVSRLLGELPENHRRWLQDWLSGLSDEALAQRDGVEVASIRKRWRQLHGCVTDPGFLARIFDIPVTSEGGEGSLPCGGSLPQPPTPNPQPPNPHEYAGLSCSERTKVRSWRAKIP
jgi:DNA-directed RNA polymerase specialized sigma24 family protein